MPPIDPDAQRVLELIRLANRPPYETLTPDEARQAYRDARRVLQPELPGIGETRDLVMPAADGSSVALRFYRGRGAAAGRLPCLVYYHGGGWVIGDLDTHDGVCRHLANAAGCAVLSVDYRMAPEHRFPRAVDDAAAALRFAAEQADMLGIDAARIAVGGDSAGGNLAAVVSLLARDGNLPAASGGEEGGAPTLYVQRAPTPCFQLLFYPATDLAATEPSYSRITTGFPLVTSTMHWFRDHYLPDTAAQRDWRASPLRAPWLGGTPPALVLTVGHDPLCDEGIAYARRLAAEGVRVSHLHLADQIHGFLTMGRVIRASATVLDMAGTALRGAFAAVSEPEPARPGGAA